MGHEEMPIYVHWRRFLSWLLNTTEKFPKRVRFTFSGRLDNLALDILEKIVSAAYTKNKMPILMQINLDVEKMRVLLSVCHEQRYLRTRSFEHAVKELYAFGQMVGGWIRQQKAKG